MIEIIFAVEKEAVECYFEPESMLKIISLHKVDEELIAV
jgi:hypothetical protein